MAGRFEVPAAFSTPKDLVFLCGAVNRHNPEDNERCGVRHRNEVFACKLAAHNIPFSCGAVCIAQTGRCVNDHLREHLLSLTRIPSGHLTLHVRDCRCTPYWNRAIVLARHRGREAMEAK